MNQHIFNTMAGNTTKPVNISPYIRPDVRLANQHWSDDDGLGFTVDHLESLGSNAIASAMKLSALFPHLHLDPYDSARCRFRGMAVGTLFVNDDDVCVNHSDSTVHQQSDNVEHPDKARLLPAVPMKEAFLGEITVLVETAFHSGTSPMINAQYGCHWKAHLLRLQPTQERAAQATPPVPHKDNARWVFVAVLAKENVYGGRNILYNNRKEELARFSLLPLQYFALDDRRLYHHVEDVCLEEGAKSGYRDALVIEINTLEPTRF